MKKVEQGSVIGSVECSGCGAEVPLKVNSAGGVYYYCARVVGERKGKPEKCMTRFNFGRTASERTINEFLNNQEQEKTENVKQVEDRQEQDTRAKPEAARDIEPETDSEQPETDSEQPDNQRRKARKLAAGFKHFLTGDE